MFYFNKIFNIIEFWLAGLIIIFPLFLAVCKAAKNGDEVNEFVVEQEVKQLCNK